MVEGPGNRQKWFRSVAATGALPTARSQHAIDETSEVGSRGCRGGRLTWLETAVDRAEAYPEQGLAVREWWRPGMGLRWGAMANLCKMDRDGYPERPAAGVRN
jgi:hypothetical protein